MHHAALSHHPRHPVSTNCSLVWCDQTLDAAVIDPGGDLDRVLGEVQRLGLSLKQIWLTHAHIDHAGGAGELAERLQLPIIGPHTGDQFWIDGLAQQSQMFGFARPSPLRPRAGCKMAIPSRSAIARLPCAIAPATRQAMWCFIPVRHSVPL